MTSDVRGQLKVLGKIDQISVSKRDEKEKELIFKAAKSRSKQDDPELAKKKEQAKQVWNQRSVLESVYQCLYQHKISNRISIRISVSVNQQQNQCIGNSRISNRIIVSIIKSAIESVYQ